jgi:hypothetical protein
VPNSLIVQPALKSWQAFSYAFSGGTCLSIALLAPSSYDALTGLAIIVPVRINRAKVLLAEARHERHLPEYRLEPRSRGLHLNVTPVWFRIRDGEEANCDLFRLEAVGG